MVKKMKVITTTITMRVGLKVVFHAIIFHAILHFRFNLVQIAARLQENCSLFLEVKRRGISFRSKRK